MTDAHGVARDQLRAFIERIERLEEEKKTIADDIKDVYAEGVERVGPDLLDLRYTLQLLGNTLPYFVGRGPVERQQQDVLGLGQAFMQGIPGLGHHRGRFARARGSHDHDR